MCRRCTPRSLLIRYLRLALFTATTLLVAAFAAGPAILIWSYTHQARSAISSTPADFGLRYEDVAFCSRRDNVSLSGWLIPSAGSRRAIIFVHGIGANRWAAPGYAASATALHAAGYTVLTFDLRAEGTSGGNLITLGAREQYDVLGAVDYLEARLGGQVRIGLLSYSMGAATAVLAAADDPRVIDAVEADSAFGSLDQVIHADMDRNLDALGGPVIWTIEHEAPLITGVDPNVDQPIEVAPTLTHTPVLYIAGTQDTLIPFTQSVALYRATGDRRSQLWLVPGAGHDGAYFAAPTVYERRVLSFFERFV